MTASQISLEPMTPDHLDGAVMLSRQAGWPHRREDWELVLALSRGVAALEDGRVVGTALMTPFGDTTATVNMIIVDESMRGRGLGRKLMNAVLESAGDRDCLLVATKDGLPLYEKLGFVATGEIVQHQGETAAVAAPAHVSPAEPGDLARIAELDRAAIGHDRGALIGRLARRAEFAVIRDGGAVAAFAALRPFGRGLVIGPVVARNDAEARALIDFFLAANPGAFVRVDTNVSTGLAGWLTERGLKHVGGGIVMQRIGGKQPPRTSGPHRIYALANQALG